MHEYRIQIHLFILYYARRLNFLHAIQHIFLKAVNLETCKLTSSYICIFIYCVSLKYTCIYI